jgi:hypothetical protein
VHLQEENVFAQLREREECDAGTWIYDTKATNHMLWSWVAFLEVDMVIHGIVRFGDDLVVEIEGCDMVVFK